MALEPPPASTKKKPRSRSAVEKDFFSEFIDVTNSAPVLTTRSLDGNTVGYKSKHNLPQTRPSTLSPKSTKDLPREDFEEVHKFLSDGEFSDSDFFSDNIFSDGDMSPTIKSGRHSPDTDDSNSSRNSPRKQRRARSTGRKRRVRRRARSEGNSPRVETSKKDLENVRLGVIEEKNEEKFTRGKFVEIDVLAAMKQGASILKYGKWGYPHFRHFQIDKDVSRIQWYSKGKKPNETSVILADVDEISEGQTTEGFKRYPHPEMRSLSFSVIYHTRTKSLDLICKTHKDHQIWTKGLRELVDNAKKQYSIQGKIDIRNLHMEIVDMTKEEHRQIRSNSQNISSAPMALSRSTLESELEVLRRKFLKLLRTANKRKISQDMRISLEDINMELDNVTRLIDNDDFAIARHQLWKLGVEIQSYKNKLHAVYMKLF